MVRRLQLFLLSRLTLLYVVEATLIGLFFIQAVRFLIGSLYARIASASLYPALNLNLVDPTLPGLVQPATVNNELTFLVYMLFLPALAVIAGRFRALTLLAVLVTAAGRYLMVTDSDISTTIAAIITFGGGLLYITLIIHQRARILPYLFVLALGLDQIYRAIGDTLDPSWSTNYEQTQLILSVVVLLLALYNAVHYRPDSEDETPSGNVGLMPFWGGIGLGGLLFVQLSLLTMPNVIASRADTNYTLIVPLLVGATLLPIVPWVRDRARAFIGLFDSSVRGWAWMLIIMLLIVLGTRLTGIVAGVSLVIAQFFSSMAWWWLARPKARKERNFTGFWMILGVLILTILIVFDNFTYEYAFVRDFPPGLTLFNGAVPVDFLNDIIPPLLRGFRGLGLAVILLSVFLALLPMVQMRRRIPWQGGTLLQSLMTIAVVAGLSAWASYEARPPVIVGISEPAQIRAGTYNIHAGFNEFYHYDMDAIALTIQQSGADVVLLQEVEAGRLTSFGVDQPLWLARRLGMDRRFSPTNEGLQGLAVLSKIEIVFDDGALLTSVGSQTGLQRVQVRPDTGVITVYNTWLDPLLDTGSLESLETSQLNQLREIFALITLHHTDENGIVQLGRTIFGGTFNNIPDSELVRRIQEEGFVDHFGDGTLEQTATFWRTGERARLDYLWTVRLNIFGRNVIDSPASDHRMATIGIQLRQE